LRRIILYSEKGTGYFLSPLRLNLYAKWQQFFHAITSGHFGDFQFFGFASFLFGSGYAGLGKMKCQELPGD
jgi:hypothetical protein